MRRPASSPRPARLLAATAVTVTTLTVTGCAELSPQTTLLEYDPADGVSAQVGTVAFRDLLLVSNGSGGPAKLSGLADNPGTSPAQITIGTGQQGGVKVTIPPASTVRLDGKKDGNSPATVPPVSLPGVTQKPGYSADLQIASGSSGPVAVKVPILFDQDPYGTQTVPHPTGASPTDHGEEGGGGH